jgi:hypothetical protein
MADTPVISRPIRWLLFEKSTMRMIIVDEKKEEFVAAAAVVPFVVGVADDGTYGIWIMLR